MKDIEEAILSNIGNRLTKELAWGLIMSVQQTIAELRQQDRSAERVDDQSGDPGRLAEK